jgi:hypothetical protein
LREWVQPDDLVHFLVDALVVLDLSSAAVNPRGTGSAQYRRSRPLSDLAASPLAGAGDESARAVGRRCVTAATAANHQSSSKWKSCSMVNAVGKWLQPSRFSSSRHIRIFEIVISDVSVR